VAAYSQFLGCRVTVRYRVGEMLLSATGTFCGDSGRSIFLEQHLEQRGTRKYFRWEVPYPYIYRIEPETTSESAAAGADTTIEAPQGIAKAAAASAGESSGDVATFPRLLNLPTPLD